jgi:hypothetical protein
MWSEWLKNIIDFEMNLATGLGGVGLAIGLFLLSQIALAVVIVALPADYFCRHVKAHRVSSGIAVFRWVIRMIKNVAGGVAILLGLPLAFPGIPGPGLVLILVGISLLDFPGKRQLQYRLISHPRVLRSINSLRSRFGRPDMIVCQPAESLAVASDT